MDKKLISCAFNIDTARVEVKYADGSMIAIDCTLVEAEVARNMYESSELEQIVKPQQRKAQNAAQADDSIQIQEQLPVVPKTQTKIPATAAQRKNKSNGFLFSGFMA